MLIDAPPAPTPKSDGGLSAPTEMGFASVTKMAATKSDAVAAKTSGVERRLGMVRNGFWGLR